jgi:predicted aldo/keto reductase-like oxidoreductase
MALKERRNDIFLTSKAHARDRKGASEQLKETLANMLTDHLDLWQVHDVRTQDDVNKIFGPDGAIEAFIDAKKNGFTRFVGVTGHHDPYILKKCLGLYDFDTVLMPINPAEPTDRSFIDIVLPVAVKKGMGVIGMKVYFRGLASRIPGFSGMEPYFRFALSHPVSTVVIGCDNIMHLEDNVGFAESFEPMTEDEIKYLINQTAPYAKQLMYYKP